MVERRWSGLLIVFLVVLAAAILPTVGGKKTAGIARSAPIPGPPAVGDCLQVREDNTDSWNSNTDPVYPVQRFAACQAGRFGEVVAIIPDARVADRSIARPPSPDRSVLNDDPNATTCRDAVWRYVGLEVTAEHRPVLAADWQPVAVVGIAPSAPSAIQQAAGQRWVACVLFAGDRTGASVLYTGSAMGSFTNGKVPSAFALCLDSADIQNAGPVACGRPHPVEAFGATSTDKSGLTQASLNRSCLRLAHQLTGMSDPTAGGTLLVTAVAVHEAVDGTAVEGLGSATDDTGFAACLTAAQTGKTLAGTLLGLGARPIPYGS